MGLFCRAWHDNQIPQRFPSNALKLARGFGACRRLPHMATPGSISNVSDTACWMDAYRAMESARLDALFEDPSPIASRVSRAVRSFRRHSRILHNSWPVVARTKIIDDLSTTTETSRREGTTIAAEHQIRSWSTPRDEIVLGHPGQPGQPASRNPPMMRRAYPSCAPVVVMDAVMSTACLKTAKDQVSDTHF